MQLTVQKETNYPKEMSYAVLAHGASSGVWVSEEDWKGESSFTRNAFHASLKTDSTPLRKSA